MNFIQKLKSGIIAGLLVTVVPPASGQHVSASRPGAEAPIRVTSVEGVTEYRFPNGLRTLLIPDSSKPTITVAVTYFVGSRHEDYGEKGMAHLLEHLMFKGSAQHRQIDREISSHGAQSNASTTYDNTTYFETFAATSANMQWALEFEADRMVHSFIAKKDLESEFSVVRNEFESGENSVLPVLIDRVMAAAYLWHNYAHTTIGARSDIENVPIERLQAFYRKYYQPDNAVLILAGKFDPATILRTVGATLGQVPKPTRRLEHGNLLIPTYTQEPVQDGERVVSVRRAGAVQALVMGYHIPAAAHQDLAPLSVLAEMLNDDVSGPLQRDLVTSHLAARVGSFMHMLREPGALITFAEVRQGTSLDSSRAAMEHTLKQVATELPGDEDVQRAKQSLTIGIDRTVTSPSQLALTLGNWAALGDWRLYFLRRDQIRNVTREDVARVARAYLRPSNQTVGLFQPTDTPDRAVIPRAPNLDSLLNGYKGGAVIAAGESFDPTPANIDARSQVSRLGNGFRLTLLPKRSRGGLVNGGLTFRFGTEQALMNRVAAATIAGAMLDRGTTTHTRQELAAALDRLKAQVQLFGGATSVTARFVTTREHVPEVLRILAEELRMPRFDSSEFVQVRDGMLARSEAIRTQPEVKASSVLGHHLAPWPKGHPYNVSDIDGQIVALKATTIDDVRRFHRDFYGADHGDLVLIGDVDTAAVRSVAASVFGEWRSTQPYERIARQFHDVAPIAETIETPDKANALFAAGMNLAIRDDSPDYPALLIGNEILGGGFLNSRLATRVRQREGLSYSVVSSLGAGSLDSAGSFTMSAIVAPQNMGKLETAMREELDRLIRDGVTETEVTEAKQGWLETSRQQRATDDFLAYFIMEARENDRTFAFAATLERKVAALTAADVNAALRKYLKPARLSIVKAGDFANHLPASGGK